jgi:hypothetical protein
MSASTMSASTKASTLPAKQASRFRPLLFPLAFVGTGVFVAVFFGYLQATVVTGLEFDTGSWTVRSFWYRRDPFSGRQLTGILREPPASLTSTAAFPNSYFSGPSSAPARWDLVNLRSGTALTEGPASVLHSYFDHSTTDPIWPTWSTENTPKAKTLWPAVRDLVDLGLYHELPKIMELATVDLTDAEFKTAIDEQMRGVLEAHTEKLRVEEKADELSLTKTMLSKYATSP